MLKYLLYCWRLLITEKTNYLSYIGVSIFNATIKFVSSILHVPIMYLATTYSESSVQIVVVGQLVSLFLSFVHSHLLTYITKKELYFRQYMIANQYKYIFTKITKNAPHEWTLQHSNEVET